jgi:hypothetical protein
MTRQRLALAALLPVLFASAIAQQAGRAEIADFQKRYNALTKVWLEKDIAQAERFLSPDYSAGTLQRPLDKKTTLDALANWDGRFRTTSLTVLGVIVNMNKATVTADLYTIGKITDKKGPHTIVIKARSLDTWQKNQIGWQLKHAHVLRSSTTIDGRPAGSVSPNHN